jgi:hypothetical protein
VPPYQKFAAIINLQFVRSIKRKLQASGSKLMKTLVLVPADIHGSKRAAAGAAAFLTANITVQGCIEKNSVVSFLSEVREEHRRLSFSPQTVELLLRTRGIANRPEYTTVT